MPRWRVTARLRVLGASLLSLVVAASVWLPAVHLLFPGDAVDAGVPSPRARQLASASLALWADPARRRAEIDRMRATNAEWDFMGRTMLVLALCELALVEPARKAEYLSVVDTILDETLRLEREQGMTVFLMPYAKARPYRVEPARSLFVDGEIALMLGARRVVEERDDYRPLLAARVATITERLRASPVMVVESYPNEAWLFDHAAALAAVRMSDWLEREDHDSLFRAWTATARRTLIEPSSGLLVSSYQVDARPLDGPEGSSIWFALHCLRLVDAGLAREQYDRAKPLLARSAFGFGWSREWPPNARGGVDVDSGIVIPILEVSPGASGLALIAAASFGDHEFLRRLVATQELAAFPVRSNGALRYAASNQVGDAVALYAASIGPLWSRVSEPRR